MDFQKKYGKILLPLITPYDENEEIDYGKYAELIEYVITNDLCDSLIVTGTTGEASLLTFDERVKLFETAVKASAGRKPVIAGTGCASTKETIALTKEAAKLGIKTCLIVCPFYNKPTQEGLYLHFKAVAEAVPEVDILLYNIPIFVGVNLEASTVARLAEIPNIVGIKDEAGINSTERKQEAGRKPERNGDGKSYCGKGKRRKNKAGKQKHGEETRPQKPGRNGAGRPQKNDND